MAIIEIIVVLAGLVLLTSELKKLFLKYSRFSKLQIINFRLEVVLTLTDECAAEIGRKQKWIRFNLQRTLRAVPMIGASYSGSGADWSSIPSHWEYNIYTHSWYTRQVDDSYNSEMPINSKAELKEVMTGYVARDWRFTYVADEIRPLLKEFELDGENLRWEQKASLALQPDPLKV